MSPDFLKKYAPGSLFKTSCAMHCTNIRHSSVSKTLNNGEIVVSLAVFRDGSHASVTLLGRGDVCQLTFAEGSFYDDWFVPVNDST